MQGFTSDYIFATITHKNQDTCNDNPIQKGANMIQVGKDAFMHEEHFRMVCKHLLNEIQLQYWGKKVADCSEDDRLKRFYYPFTIRITNEVKNDMINQLANLRKTPYEDRIAENYQMSCDSTFLVAEIINQLLLSCRAYNVSVITK